MIVKARRFILPRDFTLHVYAWARSHGKSVQQLAADLELERNLLFSYLRRDIPMAETPLRVAEVRRLAQVTGWTGASRDVVELKTIETL